MDLSLDHLAEKDHSSDRFALMLVDNVIELVLHQYARDRLYENGFRKADSQTEINKSLTIAPRNQSFQDRVKFGKMNGFLNAEEASTINYLHRFRNTAVHIGKRHQSILHSLALFYYRSACSILARYRPFFIGSSNLDKIPYRAMKHLGRTGQSPPRRSFKETWERLLYAAERMGDELISDLSNDMQRTVIMIDSQIQFLVVGSSRKRSREEVIIDCQKWYMTFFGKTRQQIKEKTDPIVSWHKQLSSLRSEKNPHVALKKYCGFMKKTEELRESISEAAYCFGADVENQVDDAREDSL